MDTDTLVEEQIEEGQRFVARLRLNHFDVTAAFWVKTSEEGRWFLYVASNAVDEKGPAPAYSSAYRVLHEMEPLRLSLFEVKLVSPSDPIVQDVLALRDHHPGRRSARFQGPTLGNLPVEEAYIYPSGSATMTPRDLLQTLMAMANRPKGTVVHPSLITLRDGSSRQAIINGFHLQLPGGLTINLLDPLNKTQSQIPAEDVVSIQ